METVPTLKKSINDDRITTAIPRYVKDELHGLKKTYEVDIPEWIRQLIIKNLPDLKQKLSQKIEP